MAVHIVFLCLLCSLAAAPAGGDRPVISGERDGPPGGIQQGIVGRVTATDGRPIANAWVRPTSLGRPSPPIPEIAIVTDADGRYRWPLRPGSYEVSVSAAGYREASLRGTVRANQTVALDFVLERER